MNFSIKKWLSPHNTNATSIISAFHGKMRYIHHRTKEKTSYFETQLVIKDCTDTVRLHVVDANMPAFIRKLRTIQKVCGDFADYLENLPPDLETQSRRRQKKT
jgi:hypothetical protein